MGSLASDKARKRRVLDTEYEERLKAWQADEQKPWVSEPIGRAFRWVRAKFSRLRLRRNRS